MQLSVAEIDALLYLSGRDPAKLRKALNIPALSPGWQQSFRELAAAQQPKQEPGWPGEHASCQQPRQEPQWPGFKTMRIARIVPETPTISSIYLAATDGTPLPEARPGQYLSIRLAVGDAAPAVRSYSLSSARTADIYRISVKHEPHGKVSSYIHATLRPGDLVDIASPRGTFVLQESTRPILPISAGIGATPVLAMRNSQQLALRFPSVEVQPGAIFVRDGRMMTSAGVSAGIDLSLALVGDHYGAEVARAVAKDMVVFMQRPGGPSQFSDRSRAPHSRQEVLRRLLEAVAESPAAQVLLETCDDPWLW